jgi:catechol 2,3-dioxygenase-like lactoylglutathione lyase family enzyme
MQAFAAAKVDEYFSGKISRRQLIETLALAATGAASTGALAASPDPALKVALVNHISYTCPDFKKAADWYSKMFNLDQVGATQKDVALPFGKRGEQPLGVTAKDVPLTHLIIRSRDLNAPAQNSGEARRKSQALVNHIAYTIADFNKARVKAELKRMGYDNPRDDTDYSVHVVDPFGFDVQISGIEMNALST